jgi:uncharacterized protein
MRQHLVLFVRVPTLGQGKRRLARQIGDVATVSFERQMVGRLLRRLANDRRWRLRLAVTPYEGCRTARRWCRGIKVVSQGAGDLGLRMLHSIAATPPGPVVLIGGDIPAIEARHIATAFRILASRDVVFGPAVDGGFWLVGARRRPRLPHLFDRVRWSSPHALSDTLAGLPTGVTCGFVDTLEDVDDVTSYRRLRPLRGF